jgi:hypothetical protein
MPDANEPAAELDERVRKLEALVAERPPDDAVADRVIEKLSALAGRESPAGAGRSLVLAASGRGVPEPPEGAVLHPPAPAAAEPRGWFLTELGGETRLVFTMYFDPRYRISRMTQFALPGIALLLVFNYFFFSVWVNITFLSPLVERVLIVLLAIFAYRLLTRELARYRDVLDYLARYSRLGTRPG